MAYLARLFYSIVHEDLCRSLVHSLPVAFALLGAYKMSYTEDSLLRPHDSTALIPISKKLQVISFILTKDRGSFANSRVKSNDFEVALFH